MSRLHSLKSLLLFTTILFSGAAFALAIPWLDDPPTANTQLQVASHGETSTLVPGIMAPQVATTTAPSTVTIPAGTRVLDDLEEPAAYHIGNSGLRSLPGNDLSSDPG